MKRIYGIIAILLLTACLVFSCGPNGSGEAESVLKKQADITEDYVNGLSDAKNANDVAATIGHYTESMKKLIPELEEFYKNYPDYKQGKIPEGMKEDIKKFETASAKIPGVMLEVSAYMTDSKVWEAMQQMTQEMEKIKQL